MPKAKRRPPHDPQQPLKKPEREAFARAVARGVDPFEAYLRLGIGGKRKSACAAIKRQPLKGRIEVLKTREARIVLAATAPTIAALIRLIDTLDGAAGPRAREARLTLKLIGELRAIVEQETREAEKRRTPDPAAPRPLTTQEWIDKYAHLGAKWAAGSGPGRSDA